MARIAHVLGDEWRSSDIQAEEDRTFNSFLLSETILFGLKSAGFVKPSPIQYQAIPLGRCGLDLIVQAKSGTGKTCVFAVIALEKLLLQSKATQALVLAPTREVAVQIWQVVKGLGCGFEGLQCHVFIGGMPVSEDKRKLKHCHIAIGTPGRIKQLIKEGVLITNSIRLFVLDEADKLLEEGFQESINWIYSSLPIRKQMLALSATYPDKLAELLELYMTNPALVRLNADRPALLGVVQFYMSTLHHSMPVICFQAKVQALLKLLKTVQFSQCIVFSNYQTRAESLCDALRKHNWPTDYISGGQEQNQRLRAIDKLKQFKCRVMVSTDLTSRGIDAENVNLVVNMDVPWEVETYLHRIGRAGRFGTRGLAVTFVSGEEELTQFQQLIAKGMLQVSVLPDPLPPDLWTYASFHEENVELGLLEAERLLSKTCCEDSVLSMSPDNKVPKEKENVDEDLENDNQNLAIACKETCISSSLCEQEETPIIDATQYHEQSDVSYGECLKIFRKTLRPLMNLEDTIEEKTDEIDEETKLLLSLNSFLVNNHEEFRLKLEDEFVKYDSNVSFTKPKEQAAVLPTNDNICDIVNTNSCKNNHDSVDSKSPQSHNVDKNSTKHDLGLYNSDRRDSDGTASSPDIIFHDYLEDSKPKNEDCCQKPERETVTQIPDEVDEETKLLLSLNSFLVSNHEEYRLKLEDEFEKYDNALMAKSKEHEIKSSVVNKSNFVSSQSENSNMDSYKTNAVESSIKFNETLVNLERQTTLRPDSFESGATYPDVITKDFCAGSKSSKSDVSVKDLKRDSENKDSREGAVCISDSSIVSLENESKPTASGSEEYIVDSRNGKTNFQNGTVSLKNECNSESACVTDSSQNDSPTSDTLYGFIVTDGKATQVKALIKNNRVTDIMECDIMEEVAGSTTSSSPQMLNPSVEQFVSSQERKASSMDDNIKHSHESDSNSSDTSGSDTFPRRLLKPDSKPKRAAPSKYKGGGCAVEQDFRPSSDYDIYLRKWWKPNTRMAVKYLEYQNFMAHLIRRSSKYS